MKKISLYPNPKRDPKLLRTREVILALSDFKGEFLLCECYSSYKALSGLPVAISFVKEEELFTLGDMMITLGGDGTILSVASKAAKEDLPIFGINLGKVGFMTALEEGEIHRLPQLLSGQVLSSRRMMLHCKVGEREVDALNEIVLTSKKGVCMTELALFVDRKKLCDFRADGLIFNTPTGSTGYAFSAGGAVVSEELDLVCVKAVSSYLLRGAHPMIFPSSTTFTVKNVTRGGEELTVCADGKELFSFSCEDEVVITPSGKRLTLLTLDKRSNMEVFFRKF